MKQKGSYRMRLMLVGFLAAMVLNGGRAKADFTFGEPTNLGPPVNSPSYGDFPCCLSSDGLEFYICCLNRPGGYGDYDAWVTKRETVDDPWGEPVNLGPTINSAYGEGARISADGLTLYIDSDRPGGHGNYDIWVATRETKDDDWGSPVNLGPVVNSSAHEMVPSVTADGLELYFAGWKSPFRPGGHGDADIWVTTRPTKDAPWGEPVNLGPVVNSSSQDARPYISSDGLLLFFDSKRSGGYGWGDLYMTRRATLSDPWGTPMNLGPIVNSSDFEEDVIISPDGSTLFFDVFDMTTRSESSCDIWQAPIIPIVDFNGDGIVDAADMCIMVDHWGENYSLCDIGPTPLGDGIVDVQDLVVLAENLFEEVSDPTLIAHWALDEAEGIIAADSVSENGYSDGIVMGDPVWQPTGGQVNGAIQLDGVDDYIIASQVLNPADGPFSILAWIKGGAPGQVIVSQQGFADWVTADAEGNLITELKCTGRSAGHLYSETVITDGQWHRIGLVWDGSKRILCVDGVVVAEDTQPGLEGSQMGLYIGTGKAMESGTYLSGLIDEIRIYNRAVTP